MRLTTIEFRKNFYQVLDQTLKTGTPVEILRRGQVSRPVPPFKSKLARLKKRKGIIGNPEDIVHMDWPRCSSLCLCGEKT